MSQTFIDSFTIVKDMPRQDEALAILQKTASLVKPIMRKHGWRLPVLAEFFPDNPNLQGLNVNMGQKILLRLRPAFDRGAFLQQEDIVQVMLHELTHNVHGPHDDKFYKFLSGLQDEYDALKRSGYAGEGFFSPGQRLGINISHNLPPHLGRLKALDAAERRRQASRILGNSDGYRLGGGHLGRNLTPGQMAAEAAERRARDNKACGQGLLAEQEAEKAAQNSIEKIVLDLSDDEIMANLALFTPPTTPSECARQNMPAQSVPQEGIEEIISDLTDDEVMANLAPPPTTSSVNPSSVNPNQETRVTSDVSSEWACPVCTLLNKPFAMQCDACLVQRPMDTWTCLQCGETGMPHDFWSCRFCGAIKSH